jgi:Zn-dependent protease with chaperone function
MINLFGSMTVQPSPAVRWLGAYSNSLLSFPYSYLVVYGNMVGPYFLLLMFLAPPFLAFPIFWLWVVLSVLYVVLPERWWRWFRDRVKLLWKRIGHHQGGLHDRE